MEAKRVVKALVSAGLSCLPVPKSRQLILCWHTFRNTENPELRRGYVSESRSQSILLFERQLTWLSKFGDFVSLDRMLGGVANESSNRWQIAITFDDGYRDNLSLALPVLKKFGAPVTLFVATDYIDSGKTPWWDLVDWVVDQGGVRTLDLGEGPQKFDLTHRVEEFRSVARRCFRGMQADEREARVIYLIEQLSAAIANDFLTWDELREFVSCSLCSVGAHTASHVNVAACSSAMLQDEIERNVNILNSRLGVDVRHFAFPYGSAREIGEAGPARVSKFGFEHAFSTYPACVDPSTNKKHVIPRMIVSPRLDFIEFRANIKKVALKDCFSVARYHK